MSHIRLARPVGLPFDTCTPVVLALGACLCLADRAPAQWNAAEEAQLFPAVAFPFADFGWAVAISGDTAVVGAQNDVIGSNFSQGSAFVFVRSGTTWMEQARLTAGDGSPGDLFGTSVAIDGDRIAVGAVQDHHTPGMSGSPLLGQGSAYAFERSGTSWSETAKLTASDAQSQDNFGGSVAVSGDTILVGAPGATDVFNGQGSCYVFTGSGSTWSEQAKLTASDAAASDRFGNALAFQGSRAVVGAWLDDSPGGFDQGSAYVFEGAGSSWSEVAKLIASDGTSADHFGNAVSLSGDTILVGAREEDAPWPDRGAAYVFVENAGAWTQQAKLQGIGASQYDQFGFSVAVLGDAALIGSPFDDPPQGFSDAGSTYLFQRIGTAWTQMARIIPPDSSKNGWFGYAVALDGDTGLVGSPDSGAEKVYVYRLSSDPVTYCTAGTSVSGCQASIAASGSPSASAPSGFDLLATDVEGSKRGLFFFGVNGQQANPWFGGSSYQCVVPPVARGELLQEVGTTGSCDGSYAYDLNARWTQKPAQNPGPGALVDAQFWYRDPFNPSGPGTSLSDAVEFCVGP